MSAEDLSDKAHLEAYQTRMKQLYHLDKFAFVDTAGMTCWREALQAGVDSFLPKPVPVDLLFETLESMIVPASIQFGTAAAQPRSNG